MRIWSILGALMLCTTVAMPAQAEEKALEERVKKLEQQLSEFQEHEKQERLKERERITPPEQRAPGTGRITEIAPERPGEEKVPLSFGATGSGRLVYAKPFLSAPKSTVGGYVDAQYSSLTRPNLDNPSRNTFGQIRMVPFIYADITDRIKFATEIEIERGGPNAPVGGDGAMQIEFAQLDYLINEAVNIRAGILLMPVGKFNLLHDSPLNDLVDRPMVSRIVIPSTWFDAGAGLYGTFYPTAMSKLDYEIYAVNGMNGTPGTTITDTGIRGARGSVSRDRDDAKSVVGRVAFSPRLGIEIAGSFYHGQYNNKDATGANTLSDNINIYAVDWTLQRGRWELIGESAWVRIDGNQRPGAIGPAGMHGYYVQANYHFMPEWLKNMAPTHFSDASTFTAVVRWERVDTDTDNRTLTATSGNRRELERLTIGLNFRPIEDTVFKFDYQFNTQKGTPISNSVNIPASGRIDGNGFLFMAATYF